MQTGLVGHEVVVFLLNELLHVFATFQKVIELVLVVRLVKLIFLIVPVIILSGLNEIHLVDLNRHYRLLFYFLYWSNINFLRNINRGLLFTGVGGLFFEFGNERVVTVLDVVLSSFELKSYPGPLLTFLLYSFQ